MIQFSCYHRIRVRILFIGDIFGRPGRTIVREKLRHLVREHHVDLVLANGENSAAGFGITPSLAEDLFDLGVDVLTTGNHVWDKREIIDYFLAADADPHGPARRVLRPANYAADLPGYGFYEGRKNDVPYAVINLQGRIFMASNDDPFRKADELLKKITAKIIFVDVHAEATSEKIALGWYLDGTRDRSGRHPYPRAHGGRARAPGRHRIHHGCWNDRALRWRDRSKEGTGDRPLSE